MKTLWNILLCTAVFVASSVAQGVKQSPWTTTTDPATARTGLQLGTSATNAASAFQTHSANLDDWSVFLTNKVVATNDARALLLTNAANSFGGVGSNLTALNAAQLLYGTVPTARLGSGTANSTTFLRGDGTWATPSSSGVTSVGLSLPAWFTVANSPVTTSGTLTATVNGTTATFAAMTATNTTTASNYLALSAGASNAVTYGSSTSNGMYFPTTNNGVAFAANGTNVVFIATNKVGIMKTNPASALDVNGTVTATTFSGSAASLTSVPAAQLSGNITVSHLNSGSGASSSTFWRGDATWAAAGGGGSWKLDSIGTASLDAGVQSVSDGACHSTSRIILEFDDQGDGSYGAPGEFPTIGTRGEGSFTIRNSGGPISGYSIVYFIFNPM